MTFSWHIDPRKGHDKRKGKHRLFLLPETKFFFAVWNLIFAPFHFVWSNSHFFLFHLHFGLWCDLNICLWDWLGHWRRSEVTRVPRSTTSLSITCTQKHSIRQSIDYLSIDGSTCLPVPLFSVSSFVHVWSFFANLFMHHYSLSVGIPFFAT